MPASVHAGRHAPAVVEWRANRHAAGRPRRRRLVVVSLAGQAQEPVFRAGVDLVTVDAIVVDKDGRPVTGLTADDFVLTVDGKPRAIDAFELVAVRVDRRAGRSAPAGRQQQRRRRAGARSSCSSSIATTCASATAGPRSTACKGLVDNLSPRDRLGLVTLPGGGPIDPADQRSPARCSRRSAASAAWSAQKPDPTLLMTIERGDAHRPPPPRCDRHRSSNATASAPARPARTRSCPIAVSSGRSSRSSSARSASSDGGRARSSARCAPATSTSLAAMDALLDSLRDVEARKTIVYVSNGVVFDQRDPGAAAAARLEGRRGRGDVLRDPDLRARRSTPRPPGLAPDWEEDRARPRRGARLPRRRQRRRAVPAGRRARHRLGAHRARNLGPLRASASRCSRRSATASATTSRWRCGASAA